MGDLAQQADPIGSILVIDSFDTPIGKIGVLGDIACSQFSSLSQFIRTESYYRTRIGATGYYVPGGFAYGNEAFRYRRNGIYGAIHSSASWVTASLLVRSMPTNRWSSPSTVCTSAISTWEIDPVALEMLALELVAPDVRQTGDAVPLKAPMQYRVRQLRHQRLQSACRRAATPPTPLARERGGAGRSCRYRWPRDTWRRCGAPRRSLPRSAAPPARRRTGRRRPRPRPAGGSRS